MFLMILEIGNPGEIYDSGISSPQGTQSIFFYYPSTITPSYFCLDFFSSTLIQKLIIMVDKNALPSASSKFWGMRISQIPASAWAESTLWTRVIDVAGDVLFHRWTPLVFKVHPLLKRQFAGAAGRSQQLNGKKIKSRSFQSAIPTSLRLRLPKSASGNKIFLFQTLFSPKNHPEVATVWEFLSHC